MLSSKINKAVFIKAMLALQALLFNLKAQNLVSNGYFEVYSNCPNNINQISYAVGWYPSSDTTNYYNFCSNGANIQVPYTDYGYESDCCGGGGYAGCGVLVKTHP